jgi:PPOX class probable F420-dependent enzyme
MGVLTDDAIRLLQGKNLAYLGTTNEDGSPHVMPMWVDVDVERDVVLLNTEDGRQKARNVRRDPRVMIASHDPANPWPPLYVRGVVERITTDGAEEHIDFLSRKYSGEPWVPKPDQVRVILEVRPDHVAFPRI